jgi:redox-sensitive bicupin YhaK (pirin superfamily)
MKTITILQRPAGERGITELGWLHGRHTFSFGEYFHPDHMGFRSLRVINDDVIEPGGGFGTHSHRDMEIFTYVIEGELEHKDSMGNGRVIRAGDLEYMSAGSGVRHSEFNPAADRQTHLLQIWIQPQKPGGAPRYADHKLATGKTLILPVKAGYGVWIHVISGKLTINGATLGSGDGAGLEDANELKTTATQATEFLAFLLA